MITQHPEECGFCSKKRGEVELLVAGPKVSICNECVQVLAEIIANEKIRSRSATQGD